MSSVLDKITNYLAERYQGLDPVIRTPYIYLDPQVVRYLFQELTGLDDAPRVRPVHGEGATKASFPVVGFELVSDNEPGARVPWHILYEAMGAMIDTAVPLVTMASEIGTEGRRLIRVQGRLLATHFPDGNLNLEIVFAGVRGLVFYTEEYFNSMNRPLLHDDRFFTLDENVEALIYLLGPVQRTIFYHQTYGDDQEYDWIPVTPAVVRSVRAGQGGAGGQP